MLGFQPKLIVIGGDFTESLFKWAGLLFIIIAAALVIPAAITFFDTVKRRNRCTELVEATVLPTRKKDGREFVNYIYDVGEYSYIHQEETYAIAWNDLTPGTTKELYYNPRDPSEAFDPQEHHLVLCFGFLALAAVFFALGAFMYF